MKLYLIASMKNMITKELKVYKRAKEKKFAKKEKQKVAENARVTKS